MKIYILVILSYAPEYPSLSYSKIFPLSPSLKHILYLTTLLLETVNLLSFLMGLPFQASHINGPYVMWPSVDGLYHVECFNFCLSYRVSMLHLLLWILFHCMYVAYFVYLSGDGHLDFFHLIIVNNTPMKT